jgi:hypothetical protein
MLAIALLAERFIRARERGVVGERAQQFVVAAARLVNPRQDRVGDRKPARQADASGRKAGARPDAAIAGRRMFERPDDRRADRDYAPAAGARGAGACRLGDFIGFVERQAPIEVRRRSTNPRRMRS